MEDTFNVLLNSDNIINIFDEKIKLSFNSLLENTFFEFYNKITKNFDIFLIIKASTSVRKILDAMSDNNKNNNLYQNLIETLILEPHFFQIMGFIYLVPISGKKVLTMWNVQTTFIPELPLENILNNFLEYALLNLPQYTLLWTILPIDTENLEQIVRSYAMVGFDKPIISDGDVFLTGAIDIFKHKCLFNLSHINGYIPSENIDSEYVLREFNAMIANTNSSLENDICSLYLTYNKSFVKWLAELPQRHTTLNPDGTLSQKEIGGSMLLDNLQEDNKQYYWELNLDEKKDFVVGTEEYVNMANIGRYVFHSHPVETMESRKKGGLHIGIPSGTDYFGTLMLSLSSGEFVIFHSIISVEGIYIISLNQELCKSPEIIAQINKAEPTFIRQQIIDNFEWLNVAKKYMKQTDGNLNVDKTHIPEYINIVSNITTIIFVESNIPNIPNMPKIFTVQFYTWSELSAPNFRFNIVYRKTNDICFNCDHSNIYRNEIIKEYLQEKVEEKVEDEQMVDA